MKNKKGFTLVELLSVIVLISLLLGLGIPGISRISKRMKERSYNTKVDLVEQAAVLWGQDNKTRLQTDDCKIDGKDYKCKKITIEELIEGDYIDSELQDVLSYKNPKDDTEMLYNYVYIYKTNNRVYAKYSSDDIFYTVYTIDGVTSGNMHFENSFAIYASGLGKISYSWDDVNYEQYNRNDGIQVEIENNNQIVYVKFEEGTKVKKIEYKVVMDADKPSAEITGITYNTNTSIAKLNLSATDNVGIVEYKITKESCDTPDGWQPWNNNTSYRFSSPTQQNGNFKLCVKDESGNIGESNTQYVANCKITGDYYFTCNVGESQWYWFGYQGLNYDFYNIQSNNNKDLNIVFKTLDGDFTNTLDSNRLNNYTDSGSNREHWNWGWYECDLNQLEIEIYDTDKICYKTNINKR